MHKTQAKTEDIYITLGAPAPPRSPLDPLDLGIGFLGLRAPNFMFPAPGASKVLVIDMDSGPRGSKLLVFDMVILDLKM